MEVKCGASRGQETTWDHSGLNHWGWGSMAIGREWPVEHLVVSLWHTLAGGLSRAGIQKDRINHLHDVDVLRNPPSLMMELSRALRREMSELKTANQNRALFLESRFLFHPPCNFP
jgi:hypothetical protein